MFNIFKQIRGSQGKKKGKKRGRLDEARMETAGGDLPSMAYLRDLMKRYQVHALKNIDPVSFKKKIDEFLSIRDGAMERFQDASKQRDLSVRFHWGHHHDFGDFSLQGRMGDRHLAILAKFMDRFHALPQSLEGMKILDIGCWTGGTSMLLCAMGAHVVAIEEVKKYVDCLQFLKESFGISNLEPKNLSLYECACREFYDQFDLVLFAGVLYHVTDPVLALRIVFDCLKDGGSCLLETAGIRSERNILAYQGPSKCGKGDQKELNRSGWNWFVPSPGALERMMRDAGFDEVTVGPFDHSRLLAVGKRKAHADIMRGGLSVRSIY
ncbi:MAG: class I SAM-dependent methyltransferase [Candidatus Omnitrophota bacterium]